MKAQVVSFRCVLKDRMGKVLSSTFNQDVITHIECETVLPLRGLAEGLQNLTKGERRRIFLSAEQAYGLYKPELVMEVSRHQFSTTAGSLCCGQEVLTAAADGKQHLFRVVRITAATITLDANHPLAGQDLEFDIEATDARDATSEEIIESSDPTPVVSGQPFLH